ncbi:hypothetical protein ACFOLA_10515 [Salinicoccus hispanicus]|uniref:Uncharacterized protein n=1 Tax=Salinicoccus hispanicus TaxID=157225 RepID=A0A6N8U2A1_9STAP|nr:hypothetical protein [Salinicoccus hispanicus]MXQ51096.1 hypothetical protein [Salinicoccus hispanicus]
MSRHYTGRDDYLVEYRKNDYEPLQLNVQRKPDTIIEFALWGVWTFVKHLIIR